jgi:hypothetical protein
MRRRAAEIEAEQVREMDEFVARTVCELNAEKFVLQRRIAEIDDIVFNLITEWAR